MMTMLGTAIRIFLAALSFAAPTFIKADKFFSPGPPVCFLIEETFAFSGRAEFVNVDGVGGVGKQNTGDFSIATSISGPSRFATDNFVVNEIGIQAICTVLQDFAVAPSAPSCNLEISLDFCPEVTCTASRFVGKLFASGTGPEPFAITGGTDGFAGAFGQLTTDGSFRTAGPPDPTTGDVTIAFDTSSIQLCVYPEVKITTTVRIFAGGDADNGVVTTASCGSKSCVLIGNRPSPKSCTVECDVGSTVLLTCDTNTAERAVDDLSFTAGATGCCGTTVTKVPLIEARCSITET